jgi:hypothetical protein
MEYGLKLFPHGICCYFIPNLTRINGGWWISVGKLVAAHGYRQKRENKLEIKK